MNKKGYSRKNFWGGENHYDADGKLIGHSCKNFWGGVDHYDAEGNKIGHSHKNFWGGVNHYDAEGKQTGHSHKEFWGGVNHYDVEGNQVGHSHKNFWGGRDNFGTETQENKSFVSGGIDTSNLLDSIDTGFHQDFSEQQIQDELDYMDHDEAVEWLEDLGLDSEDFEL